MTEGDYYRGHRIHESAPGVWRYLDGTRVADDPQRACGVCQRPQTPEGHDPCLGSLPGVLNACCGHGKRDESYVVFEHGPTLRGFVVDRFDDELELEQQR